MKDGSYIVIQAWMVSELGLAGNELLVFAVIYGFSQDGESWFRGSRGYLAEWCNTSKQTVSNKLASLVGKGLVEKRERVENGVTLNDYRVPVNILEGVQKIIPGGYKILDTPSKTLYRGGIKICPHNIEENIEETIEEKGPRTRRVPFTPPSVEEVAEYVRERGSQVDPEAFVDFYTAKGWRVGSQPMRDWRAAVRTWEKRQRQSERGQPVRKAARSMQDYVEEW